MRRCNASRGLASGADTFDDGGPSATVRNTTIQNLSFGVLASAGNLTISSSIIRFNYVGVWQDALGSPFGTVDLSGGALGGSNTVVCTSSSEAPLDELLDFPAIAVTEHDPRDARRQQCRSWLTRLGPTSLSAVPPGTMSRLRDQRSARIPAASTEWTQINMSSGTITTAGHKLSTANCTPPWRGAAANQCQSNAASGRRFFSPSIPINPPSGTSLQLRSADKYLARHHQLADGLRLARAAPGASSE